MTHFSGCTQGAFVDLTVQNKSGSDACTESNADQILSLSGAGTVFSPGSSLCILYQFYGVAGVFPESLSERKIDPAQIRCAANGKFVRGHSTGNTDTAETDFGFLYAGLFCQTLDGIMQLGNKDLHIGCVAYREIFLGKYFSAFFQQTDVYFCSSDVDTNTNHYSSSPFSMAAIMSIRFWCLPPSNSAAKNSSTIISAVAEPITRAPNAIMLALLC